MDRRRFSLLELYLQIIEESFDFNNVKKYKLIPNNEEWEFEAILNTERIKVFIYVEFARFGRFKISQQALKSIGNNPQIYNFGFEIGEERKSDQYAKATYKDYIRIIATVFSALDKFISSKKPELITFFSQSKHGGTNVDLQKDDVYFKVLDKNKPLNYELDKIIDNVDKKSGIVLFKK